MATKLVQHPTPASHMFHPNPIARSTIKITRLHRALPATHSRIDKCTRFFEYPHGIKTIGLAKASEQSFGLVGDEEEEMTVTPKDYKTVDQIKESLYDALQGINRGIFGVQSHRKAEIERLVEMLESQNPTLEPTQNLDKVAGRWKLVYSTITILGAKRTKLGLRDFIALGDFFQIIDVAEGKAVNVIEFSAKGLNLLKGQLTIEATFKIASKSKVDIGYVNSSVTPNQLMNLFKKNYDLLLQIFNPDGWLEITYVDDALRIGRDDKGNIFILERSEGGTG